jgi:predicted nucleotidyltransferase
MQVTSGTRRLPDVLGSEALARTVLHFALHPTSSLDLRGFQRRTGLDSLSLERAFERLVEWGVLQRDKPAGDVLYHLEAGSQRWKELQDLVRSSADPAEVLREKLREVPGIKTAFVFGSMARGDPRPDSDVDLLVVEDGASTATLGRAILEAEVLLDRPINVARFSPQTLRDRLSRPGGYVREAVEGPEKWVVGSPELLEAVVSR